MIQRMGHSGMDEGYAGSDVFSKNVQPHHPHPIPRNLRSPPSPLLYMFLSWDYASLES